MAFWFKTRNINTSIVDDVRAIVDPAHVEIAGSTIVLSYNDYLYNQVKDNLQKVTEVVRKNKLKTTEVKVVLSSETEISFIPFIENSTLIIDVLETFKARVPSAKDIKISSHRIAFSLEEFAIAPKIVATVGIMLEQHFQEELDVPIEVSATVKDALTISYSFRKITQETITETVVNSNRYAPMMEFLLENPHPDVEKFLFEFRDVNKGYFTTMNLKFMKDFNASEEYDISDFIRSKLNNKFTHLGIY